MRARNFPILILLSIFSLFPNLLIAEEAKLHGVWKMETKYASQDFQKALGKIVLVAQKGKDIEIFNLEGKVKIAEGKIDENKVKIFLKTAPQENEYVLTGVFLEKEMFGDLLLLDGTKAYWKAVKIKALWKCGNHIPAHTAESLEEMQQLTKTNGCKSWQIVR